jgi:hypothetical protein
VTAIIIVLASFVMSFLILEKSGTGSASTDWRYSDCFNSMEEVELFMASNGATKNEGEQYYSSGGGIVENTYIPWCKYDVLIVNSDEEFDDILDSLR